MASCGRMQGCLLCLVHEAITVLKRLSYATVRQTVTMHLHCKMISSVQ